MLYYNGIYSFLYELVNVNNPSSFLVGGVAQWLWCRSLTGGLSLIYA